MYQALYRKYRPKTLDDICGQETVVKIIKNSVNKNQINHAYLFSGPRGTGKTSIAKIFGKIVNCENLKSCIPCEKCTSCTVENNSDIIEIDAASNNGVDEIRELRNKINLVPSYGKYKIYIIDEVHMLTVGAFNALLKTLEEPPAHVIFILATTDPQKIPETIISRCQRLDFKKITEESIVENLKKICNIEKIKVDEEALYEIARLSDGGMRDSVGLLDQAKSYSKDKINVNDIHDINGTITDDTLGYLIEKLLENKIEEILKKIDYFNEKGKNFTKIVDEMIVFMRNLLLYKKVQSYFTENYNNIDIYVRLSKKISYEKIFYYIDTLNKYSKEMKTTSNTKLMFELAFIQMLGNEETDRKQDIITYKSGNNLKNNKYETQKKVIEIQEKRFENKEELKNYRKIIKGENISKNTKIEKKLVSEKDKESEEFISYIKKVRIDNTLSNFNKKSMIEIKQNLEKKLNELLLNPDYSHTTSMLLDGELKAASQENLIFVYKTNRIANTFNENLIQLENTVEKALNKKYNLIAADIDEWDKIKDEFNNKKRPFIYKKEEFDIEKVLKVESGDIISMFEDIIEYK